MRLNIGVLTTILIAGVALASDTGRHDSYVFRDGDVTWMLGEGMSASALKEIQGRFGREFLWARRSGQIFVSHDDHILDQARLAVQRNLSRSEQERRLALIADAALHRRSYVLAIDDTRITISSGTSIESLKGIRSRYPGRFLWVRLDGKSWLIQDPDWIDRATAFFAGELSLGPQQAAISREEAALDEEEERLDDRRDDASRARLEEVHRRQAEVSRREAELDQREEELEREAEAKLWKLIDDAIRQGVAQPAR
jgi:hypothetical protein